MKKGTVIIILLSLMLPVLVWAFTQFNPKKVNTKGGDKEKVTLAGDSLEMSQFIHKIEGSWVEEIYVRKMALDTNFEEEGPDLLLDIRKENQRGDRIAIYIAEYCRPEEAEYLLFGLEDGRLIYKGAEWDGCVIDIARIDFMSITYQEEEGLPLLTFEAREVDYQYHQKVRLLRLPEEQAALGWHCQMQYHLIDILTEGNYTLYDSNYQKITLLEAFGNENLLEELSFFEAFHTAWPMYEEICVSAPFEVVVLGDNHPKGNMQVYAIEWSSSQIKLYETYVSPESEDGIYPLQKGNLKVIMLPEIIRPAMENF